MVPHKCCLSVVLFFCTFALAQENVVSFDTQSNPQWPIVVGRDFEDPGQINALSIAANASEVRDPAQRKKAVELVLERHPALAKLGGPDLNHSAVMRAYCSIVTILDYSKGFGHADLLTVGPGGADMTPAREDDWGFLRPGAAG